MHGFRWLSQISQQQQGTSFVSIPSRSARLLWYLETAYEGRSNATDALISKR